MTATSASRLRNTPKCLAEGAGSRAHRCRVVVRKADGVTPLTRQPDNQPRRIHWTMRENVRGQWRVFVKRILRPHSYPPDKQERARQMALEQAEVLSAEWAAA